MTRITVTTVEALGSLSKDKKELIKLLREEKARKTGEIRPYPRSDSTGGVRLPASWAQQRLWFIDQLEGGSAGYQVPVAVRLQGALDQQALLAALDTLVQRHEVLRTVFVNIGGDPTQQIAAEGRFPLKLVDLSSYEETERETQVRLHKIEEAHGTFDLRVGPLIRGRLLRVQAQEHMLLVTMHHIITDGWSIGVFLSELTDLYRAYREGRSNPLEPLPIQYADYAQWQRRQWSEGEVLDGQLSYWCARLEGVAPQLELPTDRARPEVQSYRGENVSVVLNAPLSARLRAFAQRHEMTLFMVLYAGWAILLSRLSGQEDVATGMPIANRQRPELEGLIGFFVNTLVLRVGVRDDLRLKELLEQVKELTLGAYDHQDVPFEKVVEALQPQRSLSRSPLFQVMFVLHNQPRSELRLPSLTVTIEDEVDAPSILDLWVSLEERGDEIVGSVNYAADLFDRETVERWMACFTVLLRGMTDEVQSRIGDLPILPESERHQVVDLFNATRAPYPQERLIHELFEDRVARAPEAIAVVYEEQSLTYAELNGKANQLAHYLNKQGVQIGEYIPILMPRCLQMLIAQLAVLKVGAVYVPIDPKLPMERQAFLIRDCGARRTVVDGEICAEVKQECMQWIDCVEALDAIGELPRENPRLQMETPPPAYVMYTSGSTGVPKGVIVPHRAVNRLVINNGYAQIEPTDCVAHCSNPAFDASTFEVWGALLNGASVLIVPQSVVLEARRFAELLRQQRVTVLWMTVGLFAQYVEAFAAVFGHLRYLLVGGDVVEPGTVRRVMRNSPPRQLLNGYGPTECTTFSATYLIKAADENTKSIPIGRPISNTQIYILDSHLQPVPIGVTGEIYIGGAGVALGYLNRPELTAERFITDPFSTDPAARLYRSGDLGRWRADGNIDFLGRNDQQVKLRGFRIELGEIETQLLQHEQVKEAAVQAREDEPGEKRLVAYVVADLPKLKALHQRDSDGGRAEIVAQWKTLYEETYSVGKLGPSFVGWNSSYTGKPIPEDEMREWLQTTLERIRARKPRKVLEIGCGVGLLLQHLAPDCEIYRGTDFSSEAIKRLRSWITTRAELHHVQLNQCSALDLEESQSGLYDTVLLNSVVQYFPDVEYLLEVLKRAVRWVSPGGQIFVGDVRHLGLLRAFHSSVQLQKAAAGVTAKELKGRAARAIERDKELVIDPRFFEELPQQVPGIGGVQILLKRGQSDNELTRYRYDVVLEVGHQHFVVDQEPVAWRPGEHSVAELFARIEVRHPSSMRIRGIGNRRLYRDLAAARLIESSEQSCTVQRLREMLTELEGDGEDPEAFWILGQGCGYEVRLGWTSGSDEGRFDVELIDRTRVAVEIAARQVIGSPSEQMDPSIKHQRETYANDPLGRSLQQQLVPRLREYLKERLPAYMVPTAFVALENLPLTPSGKLDRGAFPAPELGSYASRQYEVPQGEVEENLAGIWQELLRVERVGRQDNFFELGGHSLLIVQMMERLRGVGLSATVRSVYASPTLTDLARTLTRGAIDELQVPPNLIPPEAEAITPQMLPLVELESEQIERIVRSVPGGAANIQDIYPLTSLQEGILFQYLLNEEGTDAYVLQKLLSLPSRVKLDDFIRALQKVIDRHDILRSAVLWDREQLPQPVQVVCRRVTLPVEELVLDRDRDPVEQLKERMGAERQRLELRRAPLMRLQVAADAHGSQWYALLQWHHLVCDHESRDVMFDDVIAYIGGRAEGLPEPVPYRNHVAQALAYARSHDAQVFFRSKLEEIDEPTAPFGLFDVRGDGSRIEESPYQTLEPTLVQRVHTHSRRLGMSAATLVHAAWGLVVSRTSGRDDVVYGTVLLGRLQGSAGAQRILGLFLNLLPLRLRLQGVTARELLEQTQRELAELLNHEQASLAVAQRCSGVTGSAPLFSAVLNYRHSTRNLEAELSEAGLTVLASWDRTSYPITLSMDNLGEGFALAAQTDRCIDSHRVTAYMITAMQSLVDALEKAPHTPALALSILPESERREVVELFNATQAVYPREKLIHELFEEQVGRTPDAIAVVYEGQGLTYAELNSRANQLARYLSGKRVGPNQLVGLCVERSLEMIVGMLGILKAGGAYVPLDPSYPSERLAYMLQDAAPCVLLTQERLRSTLPPTPAEVIALDGGWSEIVEREEARLDPRSLQLTSRHLAYVIYTSGSTGEPKGVMVEHRGVVNFLASMQLSPRVSATDCMLAVTTVSFDIAACEIFLPLVTGARLVLASRSVASDARLLAAMLDEFEVTVLQATPATWQLLLGGGWSGRSNLKALCGGEALTSDLSAELQRRVSSLWNLYGPTETTIWSSSLRIALVNEHGPVEPIGRPIANTQIYILDRDLRPVPIGVAGQIYVGGAGVSRGYLNRPELTAERFLPDPFSPDPQARLYKTGDLGRWRSDGTIDYLGRNDQQVKIRGFRIELREIEAQLARHVQVKEAIVVAREDEPGEKRLVAYVVGDRSVTPGPASDGVPEKLIPQLREYLKSRLPEQMIPSAWMLLNQLPLTPNGKLDRRALPAPQSRPKEIGEHIAPRTEVERTLAEIWGQVLRVDQIGLQENFFELGGHSLNGMKLIAKISERFMVHLSVAAMFQYPTIQQMAQLVESLRLVNGEPLTSEGMDLEEGVI